MSKIRLNQYSQFEIECLVSGSLIWRLALKERDSEGNARFIPDFDEETEIKQEIDGEFVISKK